MIESLPHIVVTGILNPEDNQHVRNKCILCKQRAMVKLFVMHIFPKCHKMVIKGKTKKCDTVGTVRKSNRQLVERGIHIHDCSLTWLGTTPSHYNWRDWTSSMGRNLLSFTFQFYDLCIETQLEIHVLTI